MKILSLNWPLRRLILVMVQCEWFDQSCVRESCAVNTHSAMWGCHLLHFKLEKVTMMGGVPLLTMTTTMLGALDWKAG